MNTGAGVGGWGVLRPRFDPVCVGFSAVMQTLARKNEWPLDKVNLTVDVTKKFKEEFNQPAREGAYVYGLYMEGGCLSQIHIC